MLEPKSSSIRDILSNGSTRLIIPPNQRNFDWGQEEVTELMEDLKNAQGVDSSQLFLGNFIFKSSDKDSYEVVDGQQRLTTISIILIACRTVAKTLGLDRLASKIQDKISFEDDTTAKYVGVRLTTSPSIQEVYEYMCDYDWNGNFPEVLKGKKVKRKANKIRPIYRFVFDQLKNLSEEDLSSFLEALYSSYVIQVNIKDTQEAFDMFERTNARGLELNVSDLVKNYLYADNVEDIDERWVAIVDNSKNTLQRMLKYYYISQHGLVRKKDLYRQIKKHGKDIGGERLTNELSDFSNYYGATQTLDKEDLSSWLVDNECLFIAQNESYVGKFIQILQALKLFKVTQAYPVIYSMLISYKKDRTKDEIKTNKLFSLLKLIENYHFVNNIVVEKVGNEVEVFYAEISKDFYSGNFMEIASKFEEQLRSKVTSEEEFVNSFVTFSYSSTPKAMIHYIYDRFNNYSLKETQKVPIYNPDPIFTRRNFNIDHILSQDSRKSAELDDFTKDNIDSIGNLLVMSRHSNSGFQNMPPEKKIEELKKPEHSGAFVYLRDFIKDYEQSMKNWDGAAIVNRGTRMAQIGYREIWKV